MYYVLCIICIFKIESAPHVLTGVVYFVLVTFYVLGWLRCFITNTLPLPATQPNGNGVHYLQKLKVDILRVKRGHVCFHPDQTGEF